jgi:peptidoglycan hydrolase-like protein with peptidoglycan-binding domain
MAYSLIWLMRVLGDAGLKVSEVPGWPNRGLGDVGTIKGIICHHTGGGRNGNYPTLKVVTDGRRDLKGPLSQLGLGRDGTYYIIAAGLAQHAGRGSFAGVTTGNSSFIGIEAENVGHPPGHPQHEPWPAVQLDAYYRGAAAILKHLGLPAANCIGHKEWALPKGRKPDPQSIDMDDFRAKVASLMAGTGEVRPQIPARDVLDRPTLRRSSASNPKFLVQEVQRKIGMAADLRTGNFGPLTEAAVREFQRNHGLVPDGIIGPKAWAVFETIA